MKRINPQDEIKGSNPSSGAYNEGVKEYYKPMRAKIPPNGGLQCTNFKN
jgi:hypothetical protein